MSQNEYSDKRLRVTLTLNQGYKWENESGKFASFLLTFINPSTTQTSVIRVQLELRLIDKFNEVRCVFLNQLLKIPEPVVGQVKALPDPFELSPRGAETRWATFQIDEKLTSSLKIDRYRIIASMPNDQEAKADAFLLSVVES